MDVRIKAIPLNALFRNFEQISIQVKLLWVNFLTTQICIPVHIINNIIVPSFIGIHCTVYAEYHAEIVTFKVPGIKTAGQVQLKLFENVFLNMGYNTIKTFMLSCQKPVYQPDLSRDGCDVIRYLVLGMYSPGSIYYLRYFCPGVKTEKYCLNKLLGNIFRKFATNLSSNKIY